MFWPTETLRMHPPFEVIFRECTKDYTIADTNIVIEKGTQLFFAITAPHYDPKVGWIVNRGLKMIGELMIFVNNRLIPFYLFQFLIWIDVINSVIQSTMTNQTNSNQSDSLMIKCPIKIPWMHRTWHLVTVPAIALVYDWENCKQKLAFACYFVNFHSNWEKAKQAKNSSSTQNQQFEHQLVA